MRTIIAGSRGVTDLSMVEDAVRDSGFWVTCVLSGCARGVDLLGEAWATHRRIPIARYPAKWRTEGRLAGFARNRRMAEAADQLVAIWDGKSHGTSHMIKVARDLGLNVYVKIVGIQKAQSQ